MGKAPTPQASLGVISSLIGRPPMSHFNPASLIQARETDTASN